MKDFLGNSLEIGDNVVTTPKNYRGLVKAKIKAFTKQKVRVVYINDWNYQLGKEEEFLTYPTDMVKY